MEEEKNTNFFSTETLKNYPKNSLQVAQKAITTTSKTETEGNNAFVQPSSIIQKYVSNNLIIV